MSTNEGLTSEGQLLSDMLTIELTTIPIDYWGCFYPCQVAVWRFIANILPGVLSELNSGFDAEPYFLGQGAEWFCWHLGNQDDYLNAIEDIMYPLVDQLSPNSKRRGFLHREEVPAIDPRKIELLASIVKREAVLYRSQLIDRYENSDGQV